MLITLLGIKISFIFSFSTSYKLSDSNTKSATFPASKLPRSFSSKVAYAPLYVHSFALCAPRKILEATQFHQRYRRYEEIASIPDRLRWCRHSKGLTQVEAAQKVGMTRHAYKAVEEGLTQRLEPEQAERLAQFYGVPVTDFLDEFNQFRYDGQAVRIRAYRELLGMEKSEFARMLGIASFSMSLLI